MRRATWAALGIFPVLLAAACSSSSATGGSPLVSSTQTVQAGPVTVEATWEDVGSGLSFHVKLDNHEIDLDGVALTGATLINDRGDRLAAKEWAAPSGGHHREGSLLFTGGAGPFLAGARWVELTLPAIGSNSVPPMRWTLGDSS